MRTGSRDASSVAVVSICREKRASEFVRPVHETLKHVVQEWARNIFMICASQYAEIQIAQ